jgi:hypothetical protein
MDAVRFLPFELFVPEAPAKSMETHRDGPTEAACSLNNQFGYVECDRDGNLSPALSLCIRHPRSYDVIQ